MKRTREPRVGPVLLASSCTLIIPVGREVSERVMEARRDFDVAMEKIKVGGRRRAASQPEPMVVAPYGALMSV